MEDYENLSRHITERAKIGDNVIEFEMRWDWVGDNEQMELRIANMSDDRPSLKITGMDGASLPHIAQVMLTLSDLVATTHEAAR